MKTKTKEQKIFSALSLHSRIIDRLEQATEIATEINKPETEIDDDIHPMDSPTHEISEQVLSLFNALNMTVDQFLECIEYEKGEKS